MTRPDIAVDEPFQLGAARVSLLPHNLPCCGARCTFTATSGADAFIMNLGADDLRYLAARLTLAALHAEAIAKGHVAQSVSRETTGGADVAAH